MDIQIGKSYNLTNRNKKSYVEEMFYEKEDVKIRRTVVWRSGTWEITPKNEEEVEKIKEYIDEDFDGKISPYEDFEEAEFVSSSDGVFEEWETIEGELDVDELMEQHEENVEEDEDYDYFDFEEYIEQEIECHLTDTECYFEGTPLKIEE